MFLPFLFAVFFAVFIIFSMIGWGGGLGIFLFNKKNRDFFGLNASLGICLSIVIGGLLNLFSLINKTIIQIFLMVGFLLFIFLFVRLGKKNIEKYRTIKLNSFSDKVYLAGVFIFLFLIFFQFVSIISVNNFNKADDYMAYFVFPEKMIQTGSLGNDPFSERRIVSSLGGKYFLDTFILSSLNWKNLQIMDRGVATVIFLLVVLNFFHKIQVSKQLKLLLLISITMFLSLETINISAVYLSAVLFFVFLYFYKFSDIFTSFFRRAMALSLVVSGIACLKTTLIPAAVLLLLAFYVIHFFNSAEQNYKRRLIVEFIFALLLSFLFMLPWMISMYWSSGTFLYPLLGGGFSGSTYGYFSKAYSNLGIYNVLTLGYQLLKDSFVFLFFLIIIFLSSESSPHKKKMIVVISAILLGIIIVAFVTGGYGVYRYTFSFVLAFVVYGVIELLDKKSEVHQKLCSSYLTITIFFIALMMGAGINTFLPSIKPSLLTIKSGLSGGEIVNQNEIESYKLLQQSVPDGEVILTRLNKNFILDFNRNQIYLINLPGGSSLPPGLPFLKGPEALAEYLLSNSIKYIAYSYDKEDVSPREKYSILLEPTFNAWLRSEAEHLFDFQDNMMELYKNRKVIYDDGSNFVLDLSKKI